MKPSTMKISQIGGGALMSNVTLGVVVWSVLFPALLIIAAFVARAAIAKAKDYQRKRDGAAAAARVRRQLDD